MRINDGGGGAASGKVMGPHMAELTGNLAAYDSDSFMSNIQNWTNVHQSFDRQHRYLRQSGRAIPDAFHENSYVGTHGEHAFTTASAGVEDKNTTLSSAVEALHFAKGRADKAQTEHKQLLASLPDAATYMAAPDPSSPQYAQKGVGIDKHQATANAKALKADQATHASQEQAIAHAERQAAYHNQQMSEGFQQARPKVQALFHEPNPNQPSGTATNADGGGGGSAAASGAYAPGSRSRVKAAHERIAQLQPESHYAEGSGYDLIQQQHAIIKDAMANNVPEWDPSQGYWVNADGSQADATSFATVNVDGQTHSLSSMLGGAGGIAGAAVGGGALVGGAAMLARGKLAGAFAGKVSATGAAAKSALTATQKSNLAGAGSRSGAASRAGAAGKNAAGSRTGAGSRGGSRGTAGGRGKGKDKKGKGKNGEFIADYTDDWLAPQEDIYSDDAYQRAIERKQREEGGGA